MCGFVVSNIVSNLESLKMILNHRGPDGVATYSDGNVSFLHNRLSIIDIDERSAQPMIDKSNGNIIVFNGEIYNYQELRKIYKLDCVTNSDTEVILKLYSVLGKEFIHKLKGIFSFVIYDIQSKVLLVYRDRFGVKPMFYAIGDGKFSFASEIKGIESLSGCSFELNNQTIYEYLEYGLLHHNTQTFFKGIESLEPSHYIEFSLDSGKYKKIRYYDIKDNVITNLDSKEVLEQSYDLLNNSLKLNLVSDVEVAISLSSGVDSTLLTKLAQNHQQSFKAFTFGFNEKEYDEVRSVRENFNIDNIELYPVFLDKDKMLSTLKESIYYFESPLGGLGTLSSYQMMKEVRKNNIKVVLSGEGSDEIFGGYGYYYPAFLSDLDSIQIKHELDCYNRKHNSNLQIGSHAFNAWMNSYKTTKVLAPDGTTSDSSHCGSVFEKYRINHQELSQKFLSNLSNSMYQDLFVKKIPKLLHFQDRASMANSVETRVPFLDHSLVEFMYSLPSNYKIKHGESKFLLKEILRKKFNYQEQRSTKHYVATPQREWLKEESIKNEILEQIRYGVLKTNKMINFEKFHKDYTTYSNSNEPGNSFFIWKIINLEYLLGH
jgi:asparagine synthase (glutamine-hydrolysing)